MRTTKPKSSTAAPARFGAKPDDAEDIFRRPLPVLAPEPVDRLRRQYRRSPFYLKIDGLTGPRPKYDLYGRLMAEEQG